MGKHLKRGAEPDASMKQFVQQIADGQRVKRAVDNTGVGSCNDYEIVRKLRRCYNLKTLPQVVAHFMRNEWID